MRLFILIFGLVGLGMGVGEIFILKNLYDFRSQALVTEGEVVDFVTSRGRKGGTGLGLSICRRLIERQGGSITVACDENGSRFRIWLPAA